MPTQKYTKFQVHWWLPNSRVEIYCYRTRKPEDIECFAPNHYRVVARAINLDDDDLEFILRKQGDTWTVRSAEFDDMEENYPVFYAQTDVGAVWTDNVDDELLVIRAEW
jgi:hypothetical protein